MPDFWTGAEQFAMGFVLMWIGTAIATLFVALFVYHAADHDNERQYGHMQLRPRGNKNTL